MSVVQVVVCLSDPSVTKMQSFFFFKKIAWKLLEMMLAVSDGRASMPVIQA